MELEAGSRRAAQLVRMEDQDRVSQASSVATISYFPVQKGGDDKVQTFGKGCRAAKRDPNCSVIIRGWLNKKDSAGLKLWKRRWFVLSNYCLFYYKDSREESVLGSIPLPSYNILFCTPRECRNRKHTFKVVHQGMRSYFFSADTQEDMLGWVRALSQCATMEPDSAINRRCSSYQDFTQIGGSSESMEFPKSPSGDNVTQRPRHVSRTLSEPSHLTGGRMGTSHPEHRGRRGARQSPSPSPPEFGRRRPCGPNQEEEYHPYNSGRNTPPTQTEYGSLTPRGHLGSRPHTPVGRVDIRPQDDPIMMPQTLCYAPASPKLEFKSTPNTPGSERWHNLSKPTPTYGSVHHIPSGRRPLGKSSSTGAHADLLPPLPPSSRAAHAPHPPHHHHHHHHHHRSHLSVCVLPPAMPPKPELRETPPIRPLESDADAVLTRLCGCDKLLQSLAIELAQLQVDKDSVQCALEVTRMQLEEWKSQGPRAQEGALTQKALLQEELVTIRARMCDVSVEMERVWSQYERMESELSVIRSHLQHICNFGMPQEQSQAQRELWMMEDILAGLKVNRDHFRILLGLQRHHLSSMFQPAAPHPGSPGSPTERLQCGLEAEQEPPIRPPLPQELQEANQSRDPGRGWMDSPYEGVYIDSHAPVHRRGNSQPDLLSMRTQKDTPDSQPSSRWITDATDQSTKKGKMTEEEQIERMKRNKERSTHRRKPPMPTQSAQTQGQSSHPRASAQTQGQSSHPREEVPFPLRVTRVVTAVLPTSLVARRVSVEDPPPELDTPLLEQIESEMQQRSANQSEKTSNKLSRRLVLETSDPNWSLAEMGREQPTKRQNKALQDAVSERQEALFYCPNTSRQQHQAMSRSSKEEPRPETSAAEPTETSSPRAHDQVLTPDLDPDLCLTPEQREAKLRRVERIRERVIRSAVRESAMAPSQLPIRRERQVHQVPPALASDTPTKRRATSDDESHDGYGSRWDYVGGPRHYGPSELHPSSGTSQDEDEGDGHMSEPKSHSGNKTQRKDDSGRKGIAEPKIKPPASPYHISSMMVYQREGVKGFTSCKDGPEEELEEPLTDDAESGFSSTDLRTKWFLSTNQWHGFIPLQLHGIEPLCDEEIANINSQPVCPDEVTDSNEMSPTVSQSLEKMKENHSLFYKIACDISISDSDITRNDGNSNAQTSSRPQEGIELLINESIPDEQDCNAGSDQHIQDPSPSTSSKCEKLSSEDNKNCLSINNKLQDPTREDQSTQATLPAIAVFHTSTIAAKEGCIYEEIYDKDGENTSRQDGRLEVGETDDGASDQGSQSDQGPDTFEKTEESRGTKEAEESKVDQEGSEEMKKARGDESSEAVQEGGDGNSITPSSPLHEGGEVSPSASFGKARVTVIRTSL